MLHTWPYVGPLLPTSSGVEIMCSCAHVSDCASRGEHLIVIDSQKKQQKNCVSVFYRQVSRRCQFHDVLFLSPQDGKDEMGTKYYSLTASSCPLGYIHARTLGLCYQVHLRKIHRNKAVADCASRGEHFIVIDSQQKQDHVRKQITSSSDSASKSFFIDGSDAETEGKWVYHDGRPVEFFAWLDGYPKNDTPWRDYVVANRNGAFLWIDRATRTLRRYMCQKDI